MGMEVAKDIPVYVIMRETASESPNYFVTRDFHEFVPGKQCLPRTAVSTGCEVS